MSSITKLEEMFNLTSNNFHWKNDLIVIAGPTAVGKSNIALQLAKKINGVILNADSVQVYKDLEILSARPNLKIMKLIPHYLYGFVDSSINFSVADWLSKLKQKLIDIKKNKQIPILVGGSGLYLNAAINGLAPIPVISQNIKDRSLLILNEIGIDKFRDLIYEIDPIFSNKINDKHRLLRAHSVFLQTNKNLTFWHSQKREGMVSNTISSFLMSVNRDLLYKNCDSRFNQMLVNGGLAEVEEIRNKNINRSLPIMKSLGVKWLLSYLDGQLNYEDAVRLSMRDTRNYAKRQLTWFRHNYIPKKIINL
mgnify:FL=1|jgi:tRNA dimethylallyltransferase|tara:strand:+ start:2442 stop:3365 length:924 start_codon:yes stop_codon:yes gene_type:complete